MPDEMRITEIESAYKRPMVQFTLINQRVQNRSQYDFSVIKNVAVTYSGSSIEDVRDDQRRHFEALQVSDFLTEFFGRGHVHGPLIPIYDFSSDPILTDDWMEIDTATFSTIKDEFGNWMVPGDVRYAVSRDEVPPDPPIDEVIITSIVGRVEIT
jgi:hypothetical protein